MSEVYMMAAIADLSIRKKMLALYKENKITVVMSTLGAGTAASDILDYFGLERSTKVVDLAVVTRDVWRQLKAELQSKLQIDIPGRGVAFIIPMGSIGGRRALEFFTENQNFVKEEETTLKDTKYELLVAIANQGYMHLVMDAARRAGAGGGTVIHAKGTGMEGAEKFFDVALAQEKEIVLIVARTEQKNELMRAIMKDAGMETKARAIVFSLPVTSTAGLRLMQTDAAD